MLKTKDLTPMKPESMYEISYVLFGRASIFVVCFFIFVRNFGCLIINYMIIGETLSTMMLQAFSHPVEGSETGQISWWQQVLTLKSTGVILAGLFHIPIIFRRQLQKIKIVSYMLITIVSIFAILIVAELSHVQIHASLTLTDFTKVHDDGHVFSSLSAILLSFSIQQLMFPAFAELEKRSNEQFMKASIIATATKFILCIVIGNCGALMFGKDIAPDLLVNLSSLHDPISVFMRLSFCFILMFHVPYIFFTSKECLLVMYDEAKERGLSSRIDIKIAD